MTRKTIQEVKHRLAGSTETFNCYLSGHYQDHTVIKYVLKGDTKVDSLTIPANTLSYGYFWPAKNYNLYHFINRHSETIACYFNICDSTEISDQRIVWRDLVVDLLYLPDQGIRVLDRDELPENLAPELKRLIESTTQYLQREYQGIVAEIEQTTHEYSNE